MNTHKTVNRILPIINLEHLFDFRSILFTIARYTNEINEYKINLTQNFFNTLNFHTIDQFTKFFIEKKIGQDYSENLYNEIKSFKDEILSNNLFDTVKPKLCTLSEIYYLNQICNLVKDKNAEIVLLCREDFFKEIISRLSILDDIQNIFESRNERKIRFIIKNEEEVINYLYSLKNDSSLNDLVVHIDNEMLSGYESDSSLIFYRKYFNKHSDSKDSDNFESILKLICEKTILDEKQTLNNYHEMQSNEFIYKYSKECLSKDFAFSNLWKSFKLIESIKILGKVVPGFKRGSKLLGVPTANIDMTQEIKDTLKTVCTGVYFGCLKFKGDKESDLFRGVLSIGYNPYFENSTKTIEVFLIDYEGEDFYDSIVELNIQGFLRTEAYFENFPELVTAITYDIIWSNKILS
jgi:hypothetical protein